MHGLSVGVVTQAMQTVQHFFIVGAPRCGTTALSSYLARNPQVCFSKPKEPHFFTFFTLNASPASGKDLKNEYLARLFPHRTQRHRALGEGSVSYLYSDDAIRRLLAMAPDAKLIVMVRNPIDMLRSYHLRMLYTLDEEIDDFAAAWALQERRARGEHIPRRCRDPRLLQYAHIGRLGERLEQLYELAGRERCHVVVYDDLAADPQAVYRRVLDFIGVDFDGQTVFTPKRVSRGYRFVWLHRLAYRPPALVARFAAPPGKPKNGKKPALKRLRRRLLKKNTIEKHPVPLDPDLRQRLRETFVDDVDRLAGLLGRDLGHWR